MSENSISQLISCYKFISILRLKEYNRSESERSFDETQMKKARLKSLGLAYLSPQNRSLAQSFRYMRNKPTIIAFKTPSLENCEQRPSQNSLGSMSKIFPSNFLLCIASNRHFSYSQLYRLESIRKKKPKKVASTRVGRINPATVCINLKYEIINESIPTFSYQISDASGESKYNRPVNYPVGKPLEVYSRQRRFIHFVIFCFLFVM